MAQEVEKSQTIKWVIVLLFMFGFGFLPPFGEMTQIGMRILGIFIGAIYGWTVLEILRTTLLGILAFGLTIGFPAYLASSFGISIVSMLIVFFPICGLLNKYQVIQVLAQKFVTNKFCEGHPWRMCFMIMLGAYFCAEVNVLIAAVLFGVFIRDICKIANIPMPSRWSVAMLIGVALALMCGQMMIPVYGSALVLVAALGAITGTAVNMVKYMAMMIPLSFVLMLVYLFCMRFILKVDVSPLKVVTIEALGGKKPFNSNQIKALTVLFVTLAFMVSSSIVPVGSFAHEILTQKIGLFGFCLIAVCVLFFIKDDQGGPLFRFADCAQQGFAWEPFFLVAFIVPFSSYMTGGTTGISETLVSLVGPLFELPPMLFLVLILLVVNIITNFAQNTVVVVTFLPLFFAYAQTTGFHMEGYYILLFLLAQMALATPGSSTVCGVVYSATDLVDGKMLMGMALKILPVFFIALMIFGIPWTMLLY